MRDSMRDSEKPVLSVRDLTVSYRVGGKRIVAVEGVSIDIYKNECIAVVGESGSGKSTLSLAIMRLLPPSAVIESGQVIFKGVNLLELSEKKLHKIRGKEISMIFQDPVSYLNPVYRIGDQLIETILTHNNGMSKREARERAIELLKSVGIPSPERVLTYYPHQLSGGMNQRVSIALALATNPSILIADEPTSALDLTIQAQILRLLRDLINRFSLSVMLITHDLGLVAYLADRVYVMYSGRVMEEDSVESLFDNPKHPYTQLLLNSVRAIYGLDASVRVDRMEKPPADMRGCRFKHRCPHVMSECKTLEPPLVRLEGRKRVRCWLYG